MNQRLKFQLQQIKDGDTLIGSHDGQVDLIRLYGIDCPELGQHPYGNKARQRLQQLLTPYDQMEVIKIDRDRHGRLIGEVWVVDGCINTQLLCEGHAVAYRKHLHDEYKLRYLASEAIARRSKLNFWRQAHPEMPWEYRYRHPRQ
ncbi:MAG: thermonuclease family protein [Almyronema sp.]